MKRALGAILVLLFVASAVMVAENVPVFPGILANARYVYVTSYDGNQWNPNILPDDRQAIANVQSAIQQWGKYILVYRPQEADIILAVQSRPSEDVLAVYDARAPRSATYLWRVMGRQGLQKGETPLVTDLQKAVEQASK